MNKLDFYEEMKKILKQMAKEGKIRDDFALRGNLAYFCDLCNHDNYDTIVRQAKKSTVNELCFLIYSRIHERYASTLTTEKEHKLDEVEYTARILFYKINSLDTFICVPSGAFPEWFYIQEELDRLRET